MKHTTNTPTIGYSEIMYFLLALILLLLFAVLTHAQSPQPAYKEYRGVRLGMTATEVRAKLGEPASKSDDQDFYVVSQNETTQIAYDTAQKVITISTDYTGGVGSPDYKTIVGENLLQRPDGSMFRMVMYNSEHFWVSYNKSASVVPMVTITIGTLK